MAELRELYQKLSEIAKTGSEEEIRNFIIENFESWPEDIKIELIGIFFEEGLAKTAENLSLLANFQQEVLNTYESLEKLKRRLEDRLRELELKKEILGEEENKE